MTDNDKFLDGEMLAKMAQGGAAVLRSNADEVNNLNVFPVPDGDTGDNMSMTIESGVAALENVESNNLANVMSAFSQGMLFGARGNSGVILSQFFSGMAKGFVSCDRADVNTVVEALQIGVKQAYNSVLSPTEGTILTVAREAVEYAASNITEESTIRSLFEDVSKEMYESLQRTPKLLKALQEAGVVDSGGAGLFYILKGFLSVLNGETIDLTQTERFAPAPTVNLDAFGPDSVMEYGYCTELLLRLQNSKTDVENFDCKVITDFLQTIGDSIVSFKTGSIVKIHVHTLTPEKVLEFCRQYGEFLTLKIENMSVQHNENIEQDANEDAPEMKKYGTVVVCNGSGIKEMFISLGATRIVTGGQTNNPSTNDFIAAFDKARAEHIFVFPNNGNIVMAARQAAEIYKKSVVHVIECKDLGAGYVALSSMDFENSSVDELLEQATQAMKNVTTGCVSTAIRDTEMNGVQVNNGDFIGIVGKEIISSCENMVDSAILLLDKMFESPDKFMLTVFFGKDATEKDNEELQKRFAEKHSGVEVYFVDGGQEIYPYIFVAE